MKEKLTEVDVAFSVMEIQTAKRAWETATEQLELLNHQLAEITQQINTDERSVQQLRQRRAAFDESLEQLNQQLLQVTEGLKQAEGQKVLLERSKHTQKAQQNIKRPWMPSVNASTVE